MMIKSPLKVSQPRPRAILFDYDGVLVASEPIHFMAWKQVLLHLRIPPSPSLMKEIGDRVGKTSPEILKDLLSRYRPQWQDEGISLSELVALKNQSYLEAAVGGLQLYPGVHQGLAWLQSENIQMAVVSNARRHELEKTLKMLEIRSYFTEVVSREDVSAFKPNPTHYLFAATALGREPQECLAIEDSPTGLESALLAGIPAAALLTHYRPHEVEAPIPGKPHLSPIWIGDEIRDFFEWISEGAVFLK